MAANTDFVFTLVLLLGAEAGRPETWRPALLHLNTRVSHLLLERQVRLDVDVLLDQAVLPGVLADHADAGRRVERIADRVAERLAGLVVRLDEHGVVGNRRRERRHVGNDAAERDAVVDR